MIPPTIPGIPVEFTVPTAVLLLDQVPPVFTLDRDVVAPTHTDAVPVFAASGFTVTTDVVAQVPIAYVMVAVPAVPPVTIPDELPTDAMDGALLAQVPPDTGLVSVTVCVAHTVSGPLIVPGFGFTVTTLVTKLPPNV